MGNYQAHKSKEKVRLNPRKHIPYRDSKLTRILQPALGGNSKTLIICTITPSNQYSEETISTLKFATRAKTIKNKPKLNEIEADNVLLKRYKKEISALREQLDMMKTTEYTTKIEDPLRGNKISIEHNLISFNKLILDSSGISNPGKQRRKTWHPLTNINMFANQIDGFSELNQSISIELADSESDLVKLDVCNMDVQNLVKLDVCNMDVQNDPSSDDIQMENETDLRSETSVGINTDPAYPYDGKRPLILIKGYLDTISLFNSKIQLLEAENELLRESLIERDHLYSKRPLKFIKDYLDTISLYNSKIQQFEAKNELLRESFTEREYIYQKGNNIYILLPESSENLKIIQRLEGLLFGHFENAASISQEQEKLLNQRIASDSMIQNLQLQHGQMLKRISDLIDALSSSVVSKTLDSLKHEKNEELLNHMILDNLPNRKDHTMPSIGTQTPFKYTIDCFTQTFTFSDLNSSCRTRPKTDSLVNYI